MNSALVRKWEILELNERGELRGDRRDATLLGGRDMHEHRRELRSPLHLAVALKRSGWERHVTEDISRRGLFIRLASPCQLRQLLQLHITMPGDPEPLIMLAKVVRRCTITESLGGGGLPGLGLEFFCLHGRSRDRWERLVREVQARLPGLQESDGYALARSLEQQPAPPEMPSGRGQR